MSDNPYQTPQGELITPVDPSETAGFYVVSKKKMVTLFIVTLGIYQVYWLYRNWRLYKQSTGDNIWPIPRAIFAVFFIHALFNAINNQRERSSLSLSPWNHKQHATNIVFLLIISYVLDRLSGKGIGSPITDYLGLLILFPVVACFTAAQEKVNEACGDPMGESNSRFTGANYVWIVLGVLFWALVGVGIFLPADVEG